MDKQILKQFGKRVQALREKKGWTQDELGKKANLHRTYVGSIERGERNVSLVNVEKIAQAFNTPVNSLLKKF